MAKFAIVGGTGLIGSYISRAVLGLGHSLLVVSRSRSPSNEKVLNELESKGAQVVFVQLDDVAALTQTFTGVDVVISILHGTAAVLGQRQTPILEAALAAKVQRFLPCEFGCNTQAMEWGKGDLFDQKKIFQQKLKDVGINYTLIFCGLIFDYSLPNLREYKVVTTYGDVNLDYPVTDSYDIGVVTVRAALDERCINKGVQIKANWINQAQFLPLLQKYWPNETWEIQHVEADYILERAENGDRELPLEQPERERHQINRACYVWGLVVNKNAEALDAQELFPDIKFKTIEEALQDPKFVFPADYVFKQ